MIWFVIIICGTCIICVETYLQYRLYKKEIEIGGFEKNWRDYFDADK